MAIFHEMGYFSKWPEEKIKKMMKTGMDGIWMEYGWNMDGIWMEYGWNGVPWGQTYSKNLVEHALFLQIPPKPGKRALKVTMEAHKGGWGGKLFIIHQ